MYRTDYHIHTLFSDGRGAPDDYIGAAIEGGLSEIGFSDHLTLTEEQEDWSIIPARLPEYVRVIEELRSQYTEIKILTGIEVDYFRGKHQEILEYLEAFPFDYVIGSVHYMGSESVDLGREFYKGRDMERLYEDYFELVSEAASTGLFDIMAHPDLIRIFGNTYPGDATELYQQLAASLKKYDVAFEINSNGMNKPLGDFYPDRRYLHHFAKAGVPLCINSDAHSPERVGQYFDEAYALASEAGFREVALFEGRERTLIPVDYRAP